MKARIALVVSLALYALAPAAVADLADEIREGAEMHEEIKATTRFYDDPVLNAYLTEVGNRLAANSTMPDIDWHFYIVDDDDINAFATRGGYAYVHRGLMTYLTSEAQLAAVVAHEIGHVTQRHLVRQMDSQRLGKILAFVSSVAVWNSNVGEAVSLWNAARLSGYGRDMELEADQVGAKILYESGYDPQAVIEVLGLLKDHETYTSKLSGGLSATYHGVFATHPRSDERLQQVVAQAGQLPPGEAARGRDEYRRAMEGQIFGQNSSSNAPPGMERFAIRSLGITFVFPEAWSVQVSGATLTLSADDVANKLILNVERMADPVTPPDELLKSRFDEGTLQDMKPVYEDETMQADARQALLRHDWGTQRVAVIKVGGNAYYFESSTPDLPAGVDQVIVDIIASFRRAGQTDYPPEAIKRISYRRLQPGETFTDLAREATVLGLSAEDQLRLINGYYPTGEAQPGTWIKMVEEVP